MREVPVERLSLPDDVEDVLDALAPVLERPARVESRQEPAGAARPRRPERLEFPLFRFREINYSCLLYFFTSNNPSPMSWHSSGLENFSLTNMLLVEAYLKGNKQAIKVCLINY